MAARLLQLPAVLCAFILIAQGQVVSQNSSTSLASSSGNISIPVYSSTSFSFQSSSTTAVGAYVAQGLGNAGASASSSLSGSGTNGSSTTTITKTSIVYATRPKANSTTVSASLTTAAPLLVSNGTKGFNFTVGSVCADDACAVACDGLYQTWTNASASWSSSVANASGTIVTSTYSSAFPLVNYITNLILPTSIPPPYTLCDGIPRVNASLSTTTTSNTTIYSSLVNITTIAATYTVPPPPCFVPPDLCLDVASIYRSQKKLFDPVCSPPEGITFVGDSNVQDLKAYGECNLQGGPVRLLYWPVHTAGNICQSNISTIAATPTIPGQPNTVTFDNTVLTSPTVYLSFKTLYALSTDSQYWNSSYTTTLGLALANIIIGEAPDQISSICGTSFQVQLNGGQNLPFVSGAVPLTYARLQQPVRSADYFCALGRPNGKNLTGALASTIFVDNYNPTLLFPTTLLDVETVWKKHNCSAGTQDYFLFDPPIALTQAASAAGISAAAATTTGAGGSAPTTAAQPAASVTALAEQTAASSTAKAVASSNAVDPVQSPAQASSTNGGSPATASSSGNSSSADPASLVVSSTSADPANAVASLLGGLASSKQSTQTGTGTAPARIATTAAATTLQINSVTTAIISAGGQQVTVSADGSHTAVVVVQSTTIQQGQVATVSGNVISVGSTQIVVSQISSATSLAAQTALIAVGSSSLVAVQDPGTTAAVVVAGTTLSKGGSALVTNGQTISVGSSGLIIAAGSQTSTVSFSSAPPAQTAVVVVGSSSLVAVQDPSNTAVVAIGGTTLNKGGSALVTNGQTLSVGSSGLIIAAAGQTSTVSFSSAPAAQTVLSAGTVAITFSNDPSVVNAVLVGSTVLSVGGPALTTNGHTFSAGSAGLVEDQATTIQLAVSSASAVDAQVVVTAGSGTFTVFRNPSSADVAQIGTTVLSVGGAALTTDGHTYSLASAGLVEDGATTVGFTGGSTISTASSIGSSSSPSSISRISSASVQPSSASPLSSLSTSASSSGAASAGGVSFALIFALALAALII